MVHLWRVSSVSSAPLLEPEDDDDLEHLDLNGGVGGLGGVNGSKGEAADIRVSATLVGVFFNIERACGVPVVVVRCKNCRSRYGLEFPYVAPRKRSSTQIDGLWALGALGPMPPCKL